MNQVNTYLLYQQCSKEFHCWKDPKYNDLVLVSKSCCLYEEYGLCGIFIRSCLSFYCFIIRGLWWQYCRKKSEAGKTAKIVKKISASKSPNLPKKEPSPPENAGLGTKPRSGSYNLMPAPDDQMVRSNEDLESVCIIILYFLCSPFCWKLFRVAKYDCGIVFQMNLNLHSNLMGINFFF